MNCLVCNAKDFTVQLVPCSGCGAIEYCSKECQTKDSEQHGKKCQQNSDMEYCNTIVLYQSGDIEYKNLCMDDKRQIWNSLWPEEYPVIIDNVMYKIEGHNLGRYECQPNASIPELFGNLTISRSGNWWKDTSKIPKDNINKIVHSLEEILEKFVLQNKNLQSHQ